MTNLNFEHHLGSLTHAALSQASIISRVWGEGPSERYDELASNFRPTFARIKEGALIREQQHILPYEQLQWLKDIGFTRLRLPKTHGGFDATIPELFALLIELAEADSNLPQALRVHFGFTEDVLVSKDKAFQQRWLNRIANGETVGSAWSEGGKESIDQFETHLYRDSEGKIRVKGKKYYTTGSLYADWVDVGVTDLKRESGSVVVRREDEGVEIVDDWNGFGQQLTASGTAYFHDVLVDEAEILPDDDRFKYSAAYYQLVQLAIITGLGRAATYDVSQGVAKRTRNYTHANAQFVKQDPQILQVVGQIRGAAYSAGAIVEKVAQSLQRAYLAAFQNNEQLEEEQNALAELESAQSQTVITDLILNTSTILFDALGASATDKDLGLDRYWRNVRTLASHNPRVFKNRIVGDFSVNGTLPPYQWRIGEVAKQ
ncbi:acyl-CoA dehydrogenase family protein [Acinetobacter baumannii]|uniref:acyl-CoA dehydrogenase family protein n=1 Tax=Acinetobacter baumannii TaxID=470 RepID=UPI0024475FFB|nr:acyl-CoA dehydrogenase family protein [Acinetobacter baumannii]MDH2497528.1 acyl-CoA dehydrogenase family protein [Acinetobacter baumannii]MDV7471185.1 acyl-CoA dehydrogenase family protein [Acinetobacter baumannii]